MSAEKIVRVTVTLPGGVVTKLSKGPLVPSSSALGSLFDACFGGGSLWTEQKTEVFASGPTTVTFDIPWDKLKEMQEAIQSLYVDVGRAST